MTLRVHLDHEAEVVFISFCTVKLLFPCLFHTALFGKKVTACSSQLGGEKSCSSSSSVKYLHTLFEIFLLRKSLSLFTYVHNHVLISIWNCKYLFFTLHYNPIQVTSVAQIIPALATGGHLFWLLGPFDVLPCGYAWVFFFLLVIIFV